LDSCFETGNLGGERFVIAGKLASRSEIIGEALELLVGRHNLREFGEATVELLG